MISLTVIALAVVATVSGQDCAHATCNIGMIKYYKELNCVPVQESGACCPSKFDCTAALSNRDDGKCHLNGQTYDVGARLKSEIIDKCTAECRCDNRGSGVTLTCVTIECSELFHGPPAPGCIRLYSHDQCCSTGTHCSNGTKTSAKKEFKCEHAGKSYVVGQKFWPEEEPCKECICQEAYDGTLKAPWCTEINCGIEIHYGAKIKEGCAPLFFGTSRCCPIGWRCPNDSDAVVSSTEAATTRDAPECVFGKLRLKLSETLNPENQCTECKCSVPPHVTCVQTGHC